MKYEEVRAAVLDYLRTHPAGQIPFGMSFLTSYSEQGDAVSDDDLVLAEQVFHELYLERIIIPGASPRATRRMAWPHYRVTQFGKEVLESPDYQPYDPDGYLERLKSEVADVDAIIVRYLEESLSSLQRGLLLAAAVMLGCAAEKAMLLLIHAFGNAIQDAEKQKKYRKEVSDRMISRRYTAMWKRLHPIAHTLPDGLKDDLHTILDRAFDLIRTTRNEAGHPTGKTIDRDTVRANFILFPLYCRRVYGLIDHFSGSSVTI